MRARRYSFPLRESFPSRVFIYWPARGGHFPLSLRIPNLSKAGFNNLQVTLGPLLHTFVETKTNFNNATNLQKFFVFFESFNFLKKYVFSDFQDYQYIPILKNIYGHLKIIIF